MLSQRTRLSLCQFLALQESTVCAVLLGKAGICIRRCCSVASRVDTTVAFTHVGPFSWEVNLGQVCAAKSVCP